MSYLRKPQPGTLSVAILAVTVALAACGDGNGDADDAQAASSPPTAAAPPAVPSTPITFRYEVLGNPIVGQPVGISLEIASSDNGRPVVLHYRVNDRSSMTFPESQADRIEFTTGGAEGPRVEQVTVVPQREGRLFLNVSAEIETETGSAFRTMAIPIQVDSAPEAPETDEEVEAGAGDEAVVSMPAEERQRR